MGKALVKCLYCGEQFDRNDTSIDFIKVNNRRYAHRKCAEEHENKLTKEEKDLEELHKYIKNLIPKEDYNFIKIKKQIETYHDKYQYTYSGMLSSLKWFFEIKHESIDKSHGGVGIIPYIYNDAKKYYYAIYLAQQKNQDISNYRVRVEEINIPSPRMNVRPPLKLFNLDDEEGDK